MSTVPTTESHWPPRRIIAGTLVVCAVGGFFALLLLARHVLFFLFIAIVLSTALKPLVALLTSRGLPRNLAICLIFSLLLTCLVAPAVVGLPMLVDQTQALLHTLPESYGDFRERIGQISTTVAERLPEKPAWVDREDEVLEGALQTLRRAFNYSGLVIRGGAIVLIVIFTGFLWSIHEDHTLRSLLLFLPPEKRQDAGEVIEGIEAKVGAYVRGQGLLCLAVGLMSLIAYLIIGLPHALVLAIVAGILEAVPVFGPVLGAIAPMLVALSVDPSQIPWVLFAAVVIQQSENYLLVPRIMDRSVGVNAVVTLLAIAGFSALEGLAGAVLAIPMAAIIQLLLDRYVLRAEALEPARPVSRDAISQLRFEAQEIVQEIRLQVRDKEAPTSARTDRIEETIETIAQQLDQALAQFGKTANSLEPAVEPSR
ncbi:MAG TPA: AI-2E family transporter [Pirellulales bacterium]|jgi:predicted PurR-regulated permease PerM